MSCFRRRERTRCERIHTHIAVPGLCRAQIAGKTSDVQNFGDCQQLGSYDRPARRFFVGGIAGFLFGRLLVACTIGPFIASLREHSARHEAVHPGPTCCGFRATDSPELHFTRRRHRDLCRKSERHHKVSKNPISHIYQTDDSNHPAAPNYYQPPTTQSQWT